MTPKQQLLELTYGGDVAADVAAWTADGLSWRQVADRVSERAGVTVSHESLRQWYADAVRAA